MAKIFDMNPKPCKCVFCQMCKTLSDDLATEWDLKMKDEREKAIERCGDTVYVGFDKAIGTDKTIVR